MIQKLFIGTEGIQNLKNIITTNGWQNIFVVTNNSSYKNSGAQEALNCIFTKCQVQHTRYSDFSPNPKIKDVKKGIKALSEDKFDAIVAIGGGSAMDMAKLINVLSTVNGAIEPYIKNEKKLTKKNIPLIAIPTTSGSGSEATHFAVCYIDKVKYSLAYDFMLPDIAIVDAQFTASLPRSTTAVTGMDALCQAVESYWCINSNDESKSYARLAICNILENLENAVNNPDVNSRAKMAKAAYYAGKAINITKTTAPHAISYPITSYYNIPHGHAVALTLGSFFEFNYLVTNDNLNDKRGIAYVKSTINEICSSIGVNTPADAKNKINSLMQKIGLETDFNKLGINSFEVIINNINTERLGNNPANLDKSDLLAILNN